MDCFFSGGEPEKLLKTKHIIKFLRKPNPSEPKLDSQDMFRVARVVRAPVSYKVHSTETVPRIPLPL